MEIIEAQVEVWKKIVDVQQHFNDLELRIRNFALIVTGAFLGLGGYAIKDGGFVNLNGYNISSAALVVGAALLPLIAFYLMDRLWYHRLLDGAVLAGISAEGELKRHNIVVDLGSNISKSSPFTLPFFKVKVHSRHKMDGFYGLLGLAILILTVTLAIGIKPVSTTPVHTLPTVAPVLATSIVAEDSDAAAKICRSYVQSMLAQVVGVPGSVAVDPLTSNQVVKIAGQWRFVPRC
jgi:hypothetical protein